MVLGRALTGKLHETWDVMQRGFFKTKLSAVYQSKLPEGPASDLASLKSYFGKKNVVSTVRNSFAFHYSLKDAEAELPMDVPPEELSIYFADTNGNSLYQFAEYAMGKALLDAINPEDSHAAFDQMIVETTNVVSWFNGVAQGIMFEVMEAHMGISQRAEHLEEIDIGEVALASDIKLPFFQQHTLRAAPASDA